VEVTVSAIYKYVESGKIGSVGISECSAATFRKAADTCPIGAVELELSLFETNPLKNGVAEICKEHGIPLVAYSPLGKGFLTGQLRKYEDLPQDDARRMWPRFQPEVFDDNLKLVDEVAKISKKRGCTNAQVAIAWVSAQSKRVGAPVIPIPGATAVSRVDENMKRIELAEEEVKELDDIVERIEIKGDRYPAMFQKYTEV
jgi:pyridoxine 4-dehydrogenase